jgi:low affinity Fe/Cu permease
LKTRLKELSDFETNSPILNGPSPHLSSRYTGTTIVTFLMVFLIQNTQNRETRIVTLKLDELLRGVEGARTSLVNLDQMSNQELTSSNKN